MNIQISCETHKGAHLLPDKGIKNIIVFGYYKPSDIAKAAELTSYKTLSNKWKEHLYLCQQNEDIITDGDKLSVSTGIIVKTLSHKIVLCDNLNFNETVETQICYRIRDELGIAVQDQKIIFGSHVLDKDKTLNDSNLERCASLYLIERLHTG